MRILFCNKFNFPFSGTEVYLLELMQLLKEQGHEVALFSMADSRGAATPYDRYFLPHIDFTGEKHSLLERLHLAGHAIYSRQARGRLGQMIKDFRPDIAHVRNIYHHLSPSIFWELKRHGVPVLYHLNDFKLLCPNYNLVAHGNACERCSGGAFYRVVTEGCYHGGRQNAAVLAVEAYLHRWLETYQKCVDRFLAPSQFVRNKLIENGWPSAQIEVLSHFQKVPPEVPAPTPDAPLLYFGRLSREKGIEDLLRAMQRLPQIRLVIAGEGPLRAELEEVSRKLVLNNVTFAGRLHRAELERAIAGSRFTVLLSHAYETLGKTILESYAYGRAVIASDLGSRREFVQHGKTGLLYQAGETDQLAGAIALLSERAEMAAEMGRAGREFVRERHSPDAHYQALASVYETLAATRKRPRRTPSARNTLVVAGKKPRLRIAFIGGRGVIGKYSGIEGYYEEVGKRLAASGHEVTVYCRNYFTPFQPRHNGMHLVHLPTLRSKHFETVIHTLLSTVHAMRGASDIVHYHTLGPALFSFLPRLVGKKTAVTVQGLDWQRKKWGNLASAVLRVGEQAAAKLPDTTMVVSRTLQSHFRNRHSKETTYIPNGAELRSRRPATRILEWGIEPGNYVLFLGRFSPEKNCHLLVEAYERLNTSTQLVLAGGSNCNDLYSRQLKLHASDRIRLLDYVSGDAFEELLTNAMLFVLPSDLEGLSLALLEAMGAGLCVLASDIPENRELMEGAGFTFKHGDSADLERMLGLLITADSLREAAGRAAKKRIQTQYLWSNITEEIEQAYLKMMGWEDIATGRPAVVRHVPARAAMSGERVA